MDAGNLKRSVVVVALAALLGLGGHAFAGQIDAADDPNVVGPLTGGDPECDELTEKQGEETVAKVKLCARLYAIDPAFETDEANDYGVLWVQTNVDAANGWCATTVNTTGLVGLGGTVHKTTPSKRILIDSRTKKRFKLLADAEGMATEKATVAQTVILRPNKIRRIVEDTAEGQMITARWHGSSATKLAFVLGIEVSWASTSDSPPLQPGLTYEFTKKGSC